MIDWLVSSSSVRNRREGLLLASSLLSEGYLQPAGDTSKSAAEGLSDTPFLDLSDAYYYFVSIVFWLVIVSDLLMCRFSHASCWLLKSWRKDCTEMEKSVLIFFFLWYSE